MSKSYDLPKRLAEDAMRQADAEIEANHRRGIFADGDPNHPKFNGGYDYTKGAVSTIFGYETEEFLSKQYRGA